MTQQCLTEDAFFYPQCHQCQRPLVYVEELQNIWNYKVSKLSSATCQCPVNFIFMMTNHFLYIDIFFIQKNPICNNLLNFGSDKSIIKILGTKGKCNNIIDNKNSCYHCEFCKNIDYCISCIDVIIKEKPVVGRLCYVDTGEGSCYCINGGILRLNVMIQYSNQSILCSNCNADIMSIQYPWNKWYYKCCAKQHNFCEPCAKKSKCVFSDNELKKENI